jgi:hypothetical protein
MDVYEELLEREDRAIAQLWEDEEGVKSLEFAREEEGGACFPIDDYDDAGAEKSKVRDAEEEKEEGSGGEEEEEEGGVALAGGTGPRETEASPPSGTTCHEGTFPTDGIDSMTVSEAAAEVEAEEEYKTTTSDILEGFREA